MLIFRTIAMAALGTASAISVSRNLLTASGWVRGDAGKACDAVCAETGRFCNSAKQSTLTTKDLVAAAFEEAGYACRSFHAPRNYAGSPFSKATANDDCAPFLGGGKMSSCATNGHGHHHALCYCDDQTAEVEEVDSEDDAPLDDCGARPPVARWCAKRDGERCAQDYSCSDNTHGLESQSGDYWMPCGALTIKPEYGNAKDKYRLCPAKNIIRTKDECKAAAEQLEIQWSFGQPSGFSRTGTRSDIVLRSWLMSQQIWQQHPDFDPRGFRPRFRDGPWHTGADIDGKPDVPMGCSLDRNGNHVYWNPYLVDQPDLWLNGAEYTPMGGLIHANHASSNAPGRTNIGICKGA